MPNSSKHPVPARRAVRVIAWWLLAGMAVSACGASETDEGSDKPVSSASESGAPDSAAPSEPTLQSEPGSEPDVSVPDVLDFEATTVTGDAFSGASVAGRPVVLWFWAPWCAVCRSQVSAVTELAQTYGDDVAFVGVGGLDSSDAIRAFADEVPGPTHLSDPEGDLYQRFGITEQSSFVVLDAAGRESLRTGYSDDDALAGVVADLAG